MDLYINDIEDEIEFIVMDEDTFKDDIIGSTKVKIKELLGNDNMEHTKWIDLTYEGKKKAG